MVAAVPTVTSAVCARAAAAPIRLSARPADSRSILITSSRAFCSGGAVGRALPQPRMDRAHPRVADKRALLAHHKVIVAFELLVANGAGFTAEGCDKIARLPREAGEIVGANRHEERRAVALDVCGRTCTRRVVRFAEKGFDNGLAVARGRGAFALGAGVAE